MRNIKNSFIVTITTCTTIFGVLVGAHLLYTQHNLSFDGPNIPIMNTPSSTSPSYHSIFAFAQESNESITNIEKVTSLPRDNMSQVFGEKDSFDNTTQEMNQKSMLSEGEEQKNLNNTDNIQRDSLTILLEGKTLPEEGYMHLYDSAPYKITNGHVALKVPCDDNSTSPIQVLIGSPANMIASKLEIVQKIIDPNMTSTFDDPNLSVPGEQCLYHANLIPDENLTTITDIVLNNTENQDLEFPPTATVVIGINEIIKEAKTQITNSEHISVDKNVTTKKTL